MRMLPINLHLVPLTAMITAAVFISQVAIASEPSNLINTSTPQLKKTVDHPANTVLASSNTDCTQLTYRIEGDTTMQSGCFTSTTHGLMQNGGPIILNGTDEATPLDGKGYVLTPVPDQPLIMAVTGAPTFGAILRFETFSNLQDEYQMAGTRLVHFKSPKGPPEVTLEDNYHQPVIVNNDTIAFSTNGDWLVTESPRHALIRVNLATLQITPFAAPFNNQPWDYSLPLHPMAISDDGRFVAVQGGTPLAFKVYDLSSCVGTASDNLTPLSCTSRDYWPLLNQTVSRINGEYGLAHVRFVNDSTLSFDLKFNDTPATDTSLEQWQSASYILTSDANGSAVEYMALGDSYTSGEGTFDYVTGTDTPINMCHLSLHAYPFLVTQQIFNQGRSVACSGATIRDIDNLSSSYYGQAADHTARQHRNNVSTILANFNPGYLAQMEFVKVYQPAVITVSAAGNDIGYSNILQQCAEPHIIHNTCYSSYEDKAEVYAAIDRRFRELSAMYSRLRAAAPRSTIYAIGYPQVAASGGDCALNVRLNYDEVSFTQNLVNYLNDTIKAAATTHGLIYVDIGQALAGHRLCETEGFNVAMNGLTSGKDAGILGVKFLGKESFHPNTFGQLLIANAILAITHNFARSPPLSTGTNSPAERPQSPDLSTAIKSGRSVNQLVWDQGLVTSVADNRVVGIEVASDFVDLQPNTTYRVTLDRNTIELSHGTSDTTGSLSVNTTLPGTVDPGLHTVDVYGNNSSGQPVDISGPIYIPDNSSDYDGDGVSNVADSCLTVANSMVDADSDGIDDACDPLIGQISVNNSGASPPPISPSATTNNNLGENGNDTNQSDIANSSLQPAKISADAIAISKARLAMQESISEALSVLGSEKVSTLTASPPRSISKVSYASSGLGAVEPKQHPLQVWSALPHLPHRLMYLSLWMLAIAPGGYAILKTKRTAISTVR